MPYRVRSNKPLIGPLIARIRDELTVHLRLFYIDRITERQGLFNGLLVDALRAIVVRLDSLARRWDQMMAAAERQEQLETTLAQMREELSTLKREIEELKGTRQ